MRMKLVGLLVATLATVVSAQQPNRSAAQQPARAAAPALPPLVYVCPMPGDEDVLEEKGGKCPKCGMTLEAIRLDSKFWCPTHQTLVVRDQAGKCPLDGKELVQVTLSETWSCADAPDAKLLEPWTLLANGATVFQQPRWLVLRTFVMNHLIHHRGQLSVYLRMCDIPVPALYGPSADEAN